MTSPNGKLVEVCEDMACIILDELNYDVGDSVKSEQLTKKERKHCFVDYLRFDGYTQFEVSLEEKKWLWGCK